MPAPKKTCPHEDAIYLGVDGDAYFFRCTACEEVLVTQKGKTWRIEPAAGATA